MAAYDGRDQYEIPPKKNVESLSSLNQYVVAENSKKIQLGCQVFFCCSNFLVYSFFFYELHADI
jgi:hypothetical protein